MPTDNYAAYVDTPDGAVPIKDLSAQEQLQKKAPAIIETASGESILLTDSGDQALQGLNLYGKSEQVTTTGAQLFDASKIATKNQGGATVTNNGDGSFTIGGSGALSDVYSNYHDLSHDDTVKLLKEGWINLIVEKTTPYFYASIVVGNETKLSLNSDAPGGMILSEYLEDDSCCLRIGFYSNANLPISGGTIKPMLYQSGEGTWEPYTGGAPSPSPDYPQEIVSKAEDGNVTVTVTGGDADAQALTVSTPNGLPGIPVTSGGNYTDETGQQWVADEVDFKKGVYVQRVGKVTFDGNEDEQWKSYNDETYNGFFTIMSDMNPSDFNPGYCNILPVEENVIGSNPGIWLGSTSYTFTSNRIYMHNMNPVYATNLTEWGTWLQSHPATVYYPLATPVETPLSQAELSTYAGLHTNYPTTTVVNDEGVYMALNYAADTETYIANNYVDKATYNALEDRVAAIEGAAVANV